MEVRSGKERKAVMSSLEEGAVRNNMLATTEGRTPRSRRTINSGSSAGTRVTVVYYLCRNGRHLEHPHLMELHLASPNHTLYLRDVVHRLDALRGKGMAAMYAWSCKRRYKTGFVWHDVSENDVLLPAQGSEYVLKGSQLLNHSPPSVALAPPPPSTAADHDKQNVDATIIPNVQCAKPTTHEEASPVHSRGSQEPGCWTTNSSPSSPLEVEAPSPPLQQRQQPQAVLSLSPSPSTTGDEEAARSSSSGSSTSPDKPAKTGSGGSTPSPSGDASSHCPGHSHTPYNQVHNSGIAAQDTVTQTEGTSATKELHHKTEGTSGMAATSNNANKAGQRRGPAGSCFSGTGGRSGTLESLIKAEALGRRSSATNNRRVLVEQEEEECSLLDDKEAGQSLKPANLLMRLVACGSTMSVGHHPACGLMRTTHRPRYLTTRHVHVDLPPSSPVLAPLGALIMRPHQTDGARTVSEPGGDCCGHCRGKGEESGKGMPSSSCNQQGVSNKYTTQTIKMASSEQSGTRTLVSITTDVNGEQDCSSGPSLKTLSRRTSKRMTDPSSGKVHSPGVVSFHDEKEKVIEIEERLASGARVIIQCAPLLKDSYTSAKAM
ncbi:hypothetical protein ACP70R_007354 [Stipagrostis hirtigluma subsp. patula]